jgi:hypothetical protein
MVLYQSEISCWWLKYPGNPILGLCVPLAYDYDPAMTQPQSQIIDQKFNADSNQIENKKKRLKLFINFYGNF